MDGRLFYWQFPATRRQFFSAVSGVFAICLETSVRAEWVDQRQVGAFEIRSEFALSDAFGRTLVSEISRLQDDVETILNLKASNDPIEVNLFKTKASYQTFLKQRVPEGASRPALFVKGADRSRVYVYRREGFETDVRHESTHAVLHNALPFVPMWLDEGLAEYFEVPPADRPSKNPHHASIKRAVLFGWKPNLTTLETKTDLNTMGAEQYRESWAWIHFLLHGSQPARQVLANFLFDIRQGKACGKFAPRLQADVPDPEGALIRHFKNWKG